MTIERLRSDGCGSSFVSIEPDYDWADVTNVIVRDNTIGSYGVGNGGTSWLLYACGAVGSTVSHVSIIGNTISGNRRLRLRRQATRGSTCIVLRGPRTAQGLRRPRQHLDQDAQRHRGPPIQFNNVDGVTVTGNRQPILGRPRHLPRLHRRHLRRQRHEPPSHRPRQGCRDQPGSTSRRRSRHSASGDEVSNRA